MKKVSVIRPKFVDGMLETAEDLRLEQCYLNRRLIQFGRRLGWGVVEGMDVDDYSLGRECPTLKVSAGYAIDVQGREIVLAEDQEREVAIHQDQQREIAAEGRFLCVWHCDPVQLPAAVAGKLAPPNVEAPIVRTIERAKLGFLAPARLKQGIKHGWVPLARIDMRGDKIALAKSRGLTCIEKTSWEHNGTSTLSQEWSITFSAPITKPPPQSIEIRIRNGAGTDVYPGVTDLDLHDADYRLSFKVAPIAKGTVYIRIACDFILDWKGQAVSGAYVGGCPLSGNGIAGGVFENWFEVKGKRP